MRHPRGFTLVELLVVVAVLVLLAGIVLPTATVGDDRRLDTAQLAIQDALDHARSRAYHEGVPYGVRFNTSGQWFAVVNEVGVPVDDPLSHSDYLVRMKDPGQPQGVTLTYAQFGIRPLAAFDEKGVLQQGGQIRLTCGSSERWLALNTASPALYEIPVVTP